MEKVELVYLNSLKKLVGRGALNDVILELEKIAETISKELHNIVILQSTRFNRVNTQKQSGLISEDWFTRELNQISYAILSIIDSIPKYQNSKNILKTLINSSVNTLLVPSLDEMERIIGDKEYLYEINWLQKAIRASKCVCKIALRNIDIGTGFLLKGGYLMTNHHVIQNIEQAKNAQVFFDYQLSEDGNLENVKEYSLDLTYFETSPFPSKENDGEGLDYTVIKIKDDDSMPLSDRGFLEIDRLYSPSKGDLVNIIQHPEGKTKKLALPDKIISTMDQFLFYKTDTKKGSSGSPVFNQDWKVIAIHHSGRNKYDYNQGLRIDKKGNVEPANRGVLLQNILEDLTKKGNQIF